MEIILAEHQGMTWLVGGEEYIDALLANTLPPDVSIRFVVCESKSEIHMLWTDFCGPKSEGAAPWMIHPGIARRARRPKGQLSVQFSQWSARLEEDAKAVIRDAASTAQAAGTSVYLTSLCLADGPKMAADMAEVRSGLIEAELTSLGVDATRIVRAQREAETEADSDRIEIVIKAD